MTNEIETHTKLQQIEIKINAQVTQTAKSYIAIGKLLLEARQQFPGDREFGQWRESKTLITSRQTAHSLMKIAEQFGGRGGLHDLPQTTLRALINAPESVIDEIEGRVEEGIPPTREEVRELVKEATAPTNIPDESKPRDKPLISPQKAMEQRRKIAEAASSSVEPVDKATERMNNTLSMSLEWRAKETDSPWVLFGVNDQCDGDPCSKEVVVLLYKAYTDGMSDDNPLIQQVNDAYDELLVYFGSDI